MPVSMPSSGLAKACPSRPGPKPAQLRKWHHGRVVACWAKQNYYERLGVPEDASVADVKRAFRRAARTLHPDVNPAPEAAIEFMEILQAYQALTEPGARSAYDVQMGLSSARAKDPRFARFERWRREVIPLLEAQLDDWSKEVVVIVSGWVETVKGYEDTFKEVSSRAQAVLELYPAGAAQHKSDQHQQEVMAVMAELQGAMQQFYEGVQGGPPRMALYVEKRFEQVCQMFPAYPELTWEKEWYDTADGWQDRMEAAMLPWQQRVRDCAAKQARLLSLAEQQMPASHLNSAADRIAV